jgi:hypothetical protein
VERSFFLVCTMAALSLTAFAQVRAAPQPLTPFAAITQFLTLSGTQAMQFRISFQELQKSSAEIQPRIFLRQEHLNALLNVAAPDEEAIGKIVLEIRALQREQERAFQRYHASFISLVTPEQMERVMRVVQARELVPAVAVFAAVSLIAPPASPKD